MQDLQADQRLLLQAAFTTGARADRAWRSWQALVPMNDISPAAQRALPLLHINNAANAASESRVQGIHRRAWYSNILLFDHVKPLLAALAAEGVRSVAAKQTAAVVKSRACYPLDRFHLLVADQSLARTAATLRASGWKTERPAVLAYAALHGLDFAHAGFLIQLSCAPLSNSDFWKRVEHVATNVDAFDTPGAEDQIVEAAAPHSAWHVTSMYQRLLETLTVLHSVKRALDWSLLARISAEAQATLPLADVLDHCERDFALGLPDGYVAQLRALPVTPQQTAEYRLKKRGAYSRWQRVRLSRIEYRHLRRLSAAHAEPFSVVDYLQLRWNVPNFKDVVKHIAASMKK